MKKIIGLDLGTNSIGWSIIQHDFLKKEGSILGMGSRILPMGQDVISDFNKGVVQSAAANRTQYRGVRRLRERELLRRERLLKTLKTVGWIDTNFEVNDKVSFAYYLNKDGKHEFKFPEVYQLMKQEIQSENSKIKGIPFDWTVYYLRVKGLKEKLSIDEFCWVLMNFNQKRGYYQLRGDEIEKNDNTEKYFISDLVSHIEDTGDIYKNQKVLDIHLNSGVVGKFTSPYIPNWIGENHDFLVTEKKLKDGTINVSFSSPGETDWTFRKKRIESELESKKETVGQRIYNALKREAHVKIRGKEVHTIDRKFYKDELLRLLEKQSEFYPELTSLSVSEKVAKVLYKSNNAQQKHLSKTKLISILIDDIIFYQRPLKSKKSLIEKCKYEVRKFINSEGQHDEKAIVAAPKSHPVFQEFRIWGLIHNLKITEKKQISVTGEISFDNDVTNLLSFSLKEKIFELLNSSAEVSEKAILKVLSLNPDAYALNYDKLKGNETLSAISKALNSVSSTSRIEKLLSSFERYEKLWHMIYSLSKKENLETALKLDSLELTEEEQKAISNIPPFKKDYSSLSVKAMNKLLPFMRCGKYWKASEVQLILEKNKLEIDDKIPEKVRLLLESMTEIEQYQGLQDYLVSYIVYGRHSETSEILIYNSPDDIKLLKQHSLRNPIVEQVINEALLVVKDIWIKYGRPDEIHVETGRELKLPNDKRKRATETRNTNEATNKRARLILSELMNDNSYINPYSYGHLEQIKLYEEGSLRNYKEIDDDIIKISKKADPTQNELKRYILWLEQKYKSPYTGQVIPLSKLFTSAYEVEHVIPRSVFYDDSMNNKIICETEVNKLKDNSLAYNFIKENSGKTIKLNSGKEVKINSLEHYSTLVDELYRGNFSKLNLLMAKVVPDSFISRQLNDTRYISKKIQDLLDPIVREKHEKTMRSTNLVSMVGRINSDMRNQWGLSSLWKSLMTPRFIRMNEIDPSGNWYSRNQDGQIHLNTENVEIKRLDHRHHALDALVAACVTRQHIQYLNTLSHEGNRKKLESNLVSESKKRQNNFLMPWPTFTLDAKKQLEKIIASFKTNNRVITRTKNHYTKYENKNGKLIKGTATQKPNHDFWAVRKPIHKETVSGQVTIKEYKSVRLTSLLETPELIANKKVKSYVVKLIKMHNNDISKIKKDLKDNPFKIYDKEIINTEMIVMNDGYTATRKDLNSKITEKNLESITDTGIKKELLTHLEVYNNDTEKAFSSEGLEKFNANREIPVYKVRMAEAMGKKFAIGQTGNKTSKFVESAKGTNLFFVIYRNNDTGEHLINDKSTLEFTEVIERQKQKLPLAENVEGHSWFTLSPGDIVYEGEFDRENIDYSKFFKTINFTTVKCFFTPCNIAIPIKDKAEFTTSNKFERSDSGNMIKTVCKKIIVNRLGEIVKVI